MEQETKRTVRTTDSDIEFEARNSVEIKQNNKGEVSFIVKCYGNTSEEARSEAQITFTKLEQKFGEE